MNQLLSVILTDNASSPLYEKIFEFLQSKPMLVLIATVALTALMRASIKIYNSGRLSKNDLITKSEFEDYKTKEENRQKESIRNINQTLWERTNTKIDAKLSNIEDIRKAAMDVKADSAVIKNDLKKLDQNELKMTAMEERLNQLEREIRRLKFGENTTENRRKD